MKKLTFFLAGFLLMAIGLQANPIFEVDTPEEFVKAIGSDRTIQLKGSTLILSEITDHTPGKHYRFAEQHDGYELVIFGVQNMEIIGMGDKPVKILTAPEYGHVIVFENCENLKIENVDAGHGPEKGFCTGGVFFFYDSMDITINNSILFGSGTEGITADGVFNMTVNNSVIWGCTNSIMTLTVSGNIEFNNCQFYDNQQHSLVNIYNVKDVKFNYCSFKGNRAGIQSSTPVPFFDVEESSGILLDHCIVEDNTVHYFVNEEDAIELNNTKFLNNKFSEGMNPNE